MSAGLTGSVVARIAAIVVTAGATMSVVWGVGAMSVV